jgi:PAS domain S-box-containing protein
LTHVDQKLTSIENKLDVVVGELQVNGGNSLRDVFNTLLIDSLAETGVRRAMHTDSLAFWESDVNGQCVFASNKLGELLDMNPTDVLGDGWITKLHPDDMERTTRAWNLAVKQKRTFIADYRFIHDDGSVVSTQGHCHPVLNGKRETMKFIGILTRRNETPAG